MNADNARVFIALWPDQATRDALRAWRDRWTWPRNASPVRTERLHVTLHFLGNVARAQLPALTAALAVPITPFVLEFGHPELWPHGIAVLAPDSVPEPLLRLQRDLGERLPALGLQPEARAYRPHVTLARRAADAIMPLSGPAVRWTVDGYALMESAPDGYRVLYAYN